MSIQQPLLLLLLLLLIAATSGASPASNTTTTTTSGPTAYDMLEKYNFPIGILPIGVTGYLLQEDGSFEVYLGNRRGDCTFEVSGGYTLNYNRVITGRLEEGALRELSGVSVKVLFVWLGITDVVVEDHDLRFYVGPLSATFPVDNFDECPRCGCGFDCDGERKEGTVSVL